MKSKLTRMKPEELSGMKFKEAKMILKKDLDVLQTVGPTGTSFFICTEFDFDDKKGVPMLVVGDLKGEWKKYAKEQTKPNVKTTAVGSCFMSEDGTTLTLNIERGKAKPKVIEKAISKGAEKIIPSSVTNIIFNETPKLEADDEIDAIDEEENNETGADEDFKKIIAETKVYKAIKADDSKARLAKIKDIDGLIAKWEKKNLPTNGDTTKEERSATLKKLRAQLNGHKIDISVQSRTGAEPIDAIVKSWDTYKKRPQVQGVEALADMEDRVDTVSDLKETIQGWYSRNTAPYSKKEQEIKDALDKIADEVNAEELRLSTALPAARKAHVKAMLEQITKATPEQKEKLKTDELFLWELSRVVPVAQINDANKLLGLPPVKEENEGDKSLEAGQEDVWKDPEVQEMFKDFAKFTVFDVAVDHRANPGMKKKIKLVTGAKIWKEGEPGKIMTLSSDFTFDLVEEDGTGNLKLAAGTTIYFAVRNENVIESGFKVLPKDTPLFPETPNKSHVLQGGLGDCYLLAAIASLVGKDPNAIVDMMLDKGDTVTVRLFDVKVDPTTKKKTFKAKYINVDKSIPTVGNDDLFTMKYLWVQLIEKAYAAGNFTGTFPDYQNNTNAGATYEKIDSGWPAFAFEVLTGKPGELLFYQAGAPKDFAVTGIPVTERGSNTGNTKLSIVALPWSTSELAIYNTPKTDYKTSGAYNIFGGNKAQIVKWATYVKKGAIDQLFAREYTATYSGEPTIEDFELLFKGKMKDANDNEVAGLPVLDAKVAQIMLDWIKAQKLYPGKRGSGVYSVLQINLFNDIKGALGSGKLVALGSKNEVGRSSDGKGHSGGESMSGGLVGRHAYSVLDTREVDPLKELEIRNPWGRSVQRNIKVSDRIAELEVPLKTILAKVLENVKKDLAELKTLIEDIRPKYENETDKDKKKAMKVRFDEWAARYKELLAERDKLANPVDLTIFKDKVGAFNAEYTKGLDAIAPLKKKDPNEMISTKEENLEGQEGGEFWLYLDDLTRRFSNISIG